LISPACAEARCMNPQKGQAPRSRRVRCGTGVRRLRVRPYSLLALPRVSLESTLCRPAPLLAVTAK
jgi:hypothetical protein